MASLTDNTLPSNYGETLKLELTVAHRDRHIKIDNGLGRLDKKGLIKVMSGHPIGLIKVMSGHPIVLTDIVFNPSLVKDKLRLNDNRYPDETMAPL